GVSRAVRRAGRAAARAPLPITSAFRLSANLSSEKYSAPAVSVVGIPSGCVAEIAVNPSTVGVNATQASGPPGKRNIARITSCRCAGVPRLKNDRSVTIDQRLPPAGGNATQRSFCPAPRKLLICEWHSDGTLRL